jgi:acyl carrier protein
VDRAALPEPNYAPGGLHGSYVAPRYPVEEVLASLWSEILRVPRVGVHDNFFTDLGGHSLLATQLASSIRETFRNELPLRVVFERPTVAGLAEHLLALPEVGPRVGRLAELLLQVEKMTDEEIAALASVGTLPL